MIFNDVVHFYLLHLFVKDAVLISNLSSAHCVYTDGRGSCYFCSALVHSQGWKDKRLHRILFPLGLLLLLKRTVVTVHSSAYWRNCITRELSSGFCNDLQVSVFCTLLLCDGYGISTQQWTWNTAPRIVFLNNMPGIICPTSYRVRIWKKWQFKEECSLFSGPWVLRAACTNDQQQTK